MKIDKEILGYYNSGIEFDRLQKDVFQLERERTKEIISRYLPQSKKKILDIGGGAGFYSFWLKGLGHEVHLVDPVEINVKKATNSETQLKVPLDACLVGDARQLAYDDNSFDFILYMGPLYHLVEKEERLASIQEAKRILKKGGLIFCAGISRYASLLEGYYREFIKDPDFFQIIDQDIETGQHRNLTNKLEYFTTAYFHLPSELENEVMEAGFEVEKMLAIESFGWLLPDFEKKWNDAQYKTLMMESIRRVEDNRELMSMSAHFMAIARK